MNNIENITLLLPPEGVQPEEQPDFSYEGYQVVRGEFFAHLFEPSVTLKDEKVAVNQACLRKLPSVEYVQFIVNPKEKKLAVKPCSEESRDSFRWASNSDDGKRKPRAISCRIFFAKIMTLMNWNPDYRYKLLGKLIHAGDDYLFVFDLTSAETYLRGKDADTAQKRTAHYPEEWKNQFGVPAGEHKDTIQVNIFDEYAVFKIEREDSHDAEHTDTTVDIDRFKEKEDTDTQDCPEIP